MLRLDPVSLPDGRSDRHVPPPGRVYLVGAGPGDPGLMTVRGLEALRSADVVVYDRLVNPTILDEAPADALKVDAGKRSGHHALDQDHINDLLVRHAWRGCQVVRLKGGDPFVFGRGGEEAERLAEAGVPFEVVPGVSAAIAVPASAGIPLTHRHWSSSFAVVTGHDCVKDRPGVEWKRLATAVDTLVILMAARTLPRIARELVAHGRSPDTPVALIHRGTTEAETTTVTTLRHLAEGITLEAPTVAVIGEIVALRDRLFPARKTRRAERRANGLKPVPNTRTPRTRSGSPKCPEVCTPR